MRLINQCKEDLIKLSKVKSVKERNKLIKDIKNCVIDAISEISSNCLLGNIPLTNCNYKKLQKYKNTLRALSTKNISRIKKRKLIQQKGGFLNILLPPVLTLLATAIGNIIDRRLHKND